MNPIAMKTTEYQDHTLPEGRWSFDGDVTAVFDEMLARSIPQYAVMRKACFDMARRFVKPGTAVVDLGCSRGEALLTLLEKFGAHNRYVGVEVSKPMVAAAHARFEGYEKCGVVSIRDLDLRTDYPLENASVTLCVLTLQFTPIEYRQQIVRQMFEHTLPGGCVILVEKVLGATAALDTLMVETYYALKAANGYTNEEIERKRLALEGVLVPVTTRWNEDLLKSAGFAEVDVFWRWMNFCAWVAVKR